MSTDPTKGSLTPGPVSEEEYCRVTAEWWRERVNQLSYNANIGNYLLNYLATLTSLGNIGSGPDQIPPGPNSRLEVYYRLREAGRLCWSHEDCALVADLNEEEAALADIEFGRRDFMEHRDNLPLDASFELSTFYPDQLQEFKRIQNMSASRISWELRRLRL